MAGSWPGDPAEVALKDAILRDLADYVSLSLKLHLRFMGYSYLASSLGG